MISAGTLLVCAAPVSDDSGFYADLIGSAGRIVAVDGGSRLCLLFGRTPDLVIGDLDSVDPVTLAELRERGVPLERYPSHKDATDLELALASFPQEGPADLVVTACLGGRLDHTLAALGALARHAHLRPIAAESGVTCWMLHPDARARLNLDEAGDLFSVVAVGGTARVSISGAEYPLDQALLDPLASLGVSNVVTTHGAHVTVHEGTVAVLVPHAPDSGGPETIR